MEVYRIHISSWTASFRYPNMISGFQPTLPVPPLSTINGLISAAKGDYFYPNSEKIGFVFFADAKTVDLETIYQMGQKLTQIKSNVIKREFLSDANLFLYTNSHTIANYFRSPVYPLLLGRSVDLASVREIKKIDVTEKNDLSGLRGTIIPFKGKLMPGLIQALPQYFSNTIPRRNIGTRPYYILESDYQQKESIKAKGIFDPEKEWDIYWQETN